LTPRKATAPIAPKAQQQPPSSSLILTNESSSKGNNNTHEAISTNQNQTISDLLPPTIRPLSFKERKEIFNKTKQSTDTTSSSSSSSTSVSTSSSSNANVNKRIKIETQNDKENHDQSFNANPIETISKDESDNGLINVKKQQNLLINSKKNYSNQNEELKPTPPIPLLPTTPVSLASIDQNNNNNENGNNNNNNKDDEELIDQMLMMSANNILNSAQELQVQKAKLKSKSSVKMKTFYGGEVINDVNSLNLAMSASGTMPLAINPIYTPNTQSLINSSSSSSCSITKTMNGDNRITTHVTSSSMSMSVSSSGENFNFEFIGAGVKLEKSNLISYNNNNVNNNNNNNNSSLTNGKTNGKLIARKKKLDSNGAHLRVNFTDVAETYEYPSYEFLLKELGIDPDTDPDYQMTSNDTNPTTGSSSSSSSMFSTSSDASSSSAVSFSNFLPGRIEFDQNDMDNNNKNKHDDSGDADVEDSSDYISITPTNTSNSNKNNANLFNANGDLGNTTHFSKLSKIYFKYTNS
jgi:hypothetical protein